MDVNDLQRIIDELIALCTYDEDWEKEQLREYFFGTLSMLGVADGNAYDSLKQSVLSRAGRCRTYSGSMA